MIKILKKQNTKSGFALLYVMLFIFLILVTVVITWATSMAENRLSQRTEGGAEAYQLAHAAIDDGWNEYHSLIDNSCTIDVGDMTKPAAGKVNRFLIENGSYQNNIAFGAKLTFSNSLQGAYDYRIYPTGTGTSKKQIIEGIGYYRGTKITLKGEVQHASDAVEITSIMDPISGQLVCSTRSHANDTLLIYQTGPSGS